MTEAQVADAKGYEGVLLAMSMDGPVSLIGAEQPFESCEFSSVSEKRGVYMLSFPSHLPGCLVQ